MASSTSAEKTRNDKYLIIKKDVEDDNVVSYGSNLIKKINDERILDREVSGDVLKDDAKFRNLIGELAGMGYLVFQLTRL